MSSTAERARGRHPRGQDSLDAATGDEVLVRITRKPNRAGIEPGRRDPARPGAGHAPVRRHLLRARRPGFVRVDGTVFSHSIAVGDPGAKGARPDDKVVIEMLRFPSPEDRGEGVITEVLGARGQPGVDTLSIIRDFGLPDKFPEECWKKPAKPRPRSTRTTSHGREDFTGWPIITIDPGGRPRLRRRHLAARSTRRASTGSSGVHIADVAHFVPPGSALDREARKRGTSVYLPQRVMPMFPEVISNSLASLQQGKVRYVKSALMDFTPAGAAHGSHASPTPPSASRALQLRTGDGASSTTPKRNGGGPRGPEVLALLLRMRDLAMILRKRRIKRGALELNMPETELEFDDQGRVTGRPFRQARHQPPGHRGVHAGGQ